MKRIDKIVRFVIIFALGACTYGFVGAAVEATDGRTAGNAGGEILVIPLIIGLIALGWQLKALHK